MDKVTQEQFRSKIEARIAEIKDTLEATAGDTEAISPDVSIGRLSRLDSMQMQQMALGVQQRMRAERDRLKEALQLIDRGKYGTCQLCRGDIPLERMEFQLDAVVCVQCMRSARR